MAETVITNMTMLEVDGKVLVIDRIKDFKGLHFREEKMNQVKVYMIQQYGNLERKQDLPFLN